MLGWLTKAMTTWLTTNTNDQPHLDEPHKLTSRKKKKKKKKKKKEKKLIDYIHTMEIWLQVDYNKKWLQVLVWG